MAPDSRELDSRTSRKSSRTFVILCVDDERLALAVRAKVLARAGYVVLTATTASGAAELVRQNQVDLVLTEYRLPDSNTGADVLRHVKQLRPEVPVAIYSGVFEIPEEAKEANAFISKTVGTQGLLGEVAKLLNL